MSIADSTISGHNVAADEGGGVYGRNSEITVTGTTVSDNEAGNGGGFYLSNSPTTIESTTISGNTTTDDGGGGIKAGYYQPDEGEPGATTAGPDATLTIRNSTVSNNTAQYYGGGLYVRSRARRPSRTPPSPATTPSRRVGSTVATPASRSPR